MLETITLRGTCGDFNSKQHFPPLRTLGLLDLLCTKRRTLTFPVDSPLTSAKLTAMAYVRSLNGKENVFFELRIPVLATISGQTFFPEGLESLPIQLHCVRLIASLVLLKLGMSKTEIDCFQQSAMICETEFVWYSQQNSGPKPTFKSGRATADALVQTPMLSLTVDDDVETLLVNCGSADLFVSQCLNPEHIEAIQKASHVLDGCTKVKLTLNQHALFKLCVIRFEDLQPHAVLAVIRQLQARFATQLAEVAIHLPVDGSTQFGGSMQEELPSLPALLNLLYIGYRHLTRSAHDFKGANVRQWCNNIDRWAHTHQMTLIGERPRFDVECY